MKLFSNLNREEISESFLTGAFLIMSGGFQDAYSYCCRGEVFANAQTGNIVLLSIGILNGDILASLRYLVPLMSFALGVMVSEAVRRRCTGSVMLHWRQIVVLAEIAILFFSAFFPQQMNLYCNALISFSCAMQVQAFRKIEGAAYASTMCVGNLRSFADALCGYAFTGDRADFGKAAIYLKVILLFALGAALGGIACNAFGEYAIWFSCLMLLISFAIMMLAKGNEG